MLELIALTLEDARAAVEAGAQRIELVGTMDKDGLAPTPELTAQIVRELPDLKVRPMLRLEEGFGTEREEELIELAHQFAAIGVDGVVFGYLDEAGALDLPLIARIAQALEGQCPFTIHRAVDHAADYQGTWDALLTLDPRPDVVLTAGSTGGVGVGMPQLAEAIRRHPEAAQMIQAGGGLKLQHVAQLRELGISQFHVGSGVRADGTFDSPISAEKVREWLAEIG